MYNFREACIVFHKNTVIDINVGNTTSVEFDFIRIMDYLRSSKLSIKDISKEIFFVHSHSDVFGPHPSATDIELIERFREAFGHKDFTFAIVTKNSGYWITKGGNSVYSITNKPYNGLFEIGSQPLFYFIDIVLKLSYYDKFRDSVDTNQDLSHENKYTDYQITEISGVDDIVR